MSYKNNKKWRKRRNEIWQKQKWRYYKQFEKDAYNSHQRYTIREDNMILNKEYPDRIIAKKIGRTVNTIQVRRGKIKEEG